MKTLLFACSLALVLAGCASPVKMYSGPDRAASELVTYWRLNYAEFTGSQIYTLMINGRDISKNPPSSPHAQWQLEPGRHTVRITFSDAESIWLPSFLTVKVFQGWYEISFDTKAGFSYAPIFDLGLPRQEWARRMCIAELKPGEGLSDSRKPMPYVACAGPSIEPTPENIKVCQQFQGLGRLPVVYAEFCNPSK
jgi:hypothetical protein